MTGPLSFYIADDVCDRHSTGAILASLPLSYNASAATVEGGITAVDGSQDWPGATARALAAGAAGVIVVQPQPADLREFRAGFKSGVVVLDSRWASNPVVTSASSALRAVSGYRLECRIVVHVGGSLRIALLDQLSLVRALVGPAIDLRILHQSEHGYISEAQPGDLAVDLHVVRTNAPPEHAQVRLLTGDGSVEVEISSGETARPARLTPNGPQGQCWRTPCTSRATARPGAGCTSSSASVARAPTSTPSTPTSPRHRRSTDPRLNLGAGRTLPLRHLVTKCPAQTEK
jgi:hypothetical protein